MRIDAFEPFGMQVLHCGNDFVITEVDGEFVFLAAGELVSDSEPLGCNGPDGTRRVGPVMGLTTVGPGEKFFEVAESLLAEHKLADKGQRVEHLAAKLVGGSDEVVQKLRVG